VDLAALSRAVVAVACLPHPPLIVPAIAAGASTETDDLRAACMSALHRVLGARPTSLVVIGAAGQPVGWRGFAPGLPGLPETTSSLPFAVASWLLDAAACPESALPRLQLAVEIDGTPSDAGEFIPDGPIGLLIMGDGSARRSLKGPGYLDERAEPFDAAVTAALAKADAAALRDLDVDLATQLLATGVGPWRALGRIASVSTTTQNDWDCALHYAAAPYGVQYTVVSWVRG